MERLVKFVSKSFPSDPEKGLLGSIDLNLNYLQTVGVPLFQTKQTNRAYKRFIVVYALLAVTIHRLLYLAFELYDLRFCWMNLNELTQNMCVSLTHSCGIIKLCMILFRLKDVRKICHQFEFMSKKYAKSDEQISVFHKNEFVTKVFFICYATSVGIAAIVAMLMVIINPNVLEKSFPFKARLPELVPFQVKVVYMPLSIIVTSLQVVGIDYLNVTFINLTRGQLQVLNIALEQLDETKAGEVTGDKLKHLNSIVEHHTLILDIRRQIESVFKFPMLVQFCASLLIFAVAGFQALVKTEMYILVFVGNILGQLLLYCWFGNEVSEENKTLALRGYETSWYNFDVKFRKTLLLFLLNAQRPLFFTAGGYASLSLVTYSNILSKSYTYVAVLRQQYSK